MADGNRKSLRRATIVFWVLLLYIIAALIWWLISLEQQNKTIHELKKETLLQQGSNKTSAEWKRISRSQKRDSFKYIAEGVTFLLLILIGAVYIYRLVRRQFQLQQQQQNFVMAVTHELKTPISVARLNLETLKKHQLEEEKRKKLMGVALQETMRLDTLINNILISTQLDGNAYKTAKEELDLSALVREVLGQFKSRYPEKRVTEEGMAPLLFKGDPLLLKLLVSNLLENANKYSAKETAISCRLQKEGEKVRLQVTDEGIGIEEEEKKKVFKKFYRIGNEQVRRTKGTGLGLYICKKIVQEHGGSITITDNFPQGSTFTVLLNT